MKNLQINTQRITAWSYSRYQTYTQCPFKAKLQFIDKHKTEESDAQREGKHLHRLLDVYLKSKGGQAPKPLKMFEKELRELRKLKAKSEVQWAFRVDWSSCGWFDHDAWLRLAIDALVVGKGSMRVVDLKTGKERDRDIEQLSLYALCAFVVDPSIKEVSSELWYNKTERIVSLVFKRREQKALLKDWSEKIEAMMNDEDFVKNPGFLCGWCDFNKKSGKNLCEF